MKIEVYIDNTDKEIVKRWEWHLNNRDYPYKKSKSGDITTYTVEVKEAQDAYWLGCNSVAIANKLFDSSLTVTM